MNHEKTGGVDVVANKIYIYVYVLYSCKQGFPLRSYVRGRCILLLTSPLIRLTRSVLFIDLIINNMVINSMVLSQY